MSNPNKAQGTAFETWAVKRLDGAGLGARRLAEGGRYDPGDVEFYDAAGHRWLLECKARERLAVPRTLANTLRKADASRDSFDYAALAWKRLTLKEGQTNRTPDGVPVTVTLTWPTFVDLVNRPTDPREYQPRVSDLLA